jgi:hypothetical protein
VTSWIAVDEFCDWGYAFGEDGFVEIAAYQDGAIVISSGDFVRRHADAGREEWLVVGRGRGRDEIALVRDGRRDRLPLDKFLCANPRYLAGQQLSYDGGRWQVEEVGNGQLSMRSGEQTLHVRDVSELVRANLAELRDRTVLLVDKG